MTTTPVRRKIVWHRDFDHRASPTLAQYAKPRTDALGPLAHSLKTPVWVPFRSQYFRIYPAPVVTNQYTRSAAKILDFNLDVSCPRIRNALTTASRTIRKICSPIFGFNGFGFPVTKIRSRPLPLSFRQWKWRVSRLSQENKVFQFELIGRCSHSGSVVW